MVFLLKENFTRLILSIYKNLKLQKCSYSEYSERLKKRMTSIRDTKMLCKSKSCFGSKKQKQWQNIDSEKHEWG